MTIRLSTSRNARTTIPPALHPYPAYKMHGPHTSVWPNTAGLRESSDEGCRGESRRCKEPGVRITHTQVTMTHIIRRILCHPRVSAGTPKVAVITKERQNKERKQLVCGGRGFDPLTVDAIAGVNCNRAVRRPQCQIVSPSFLPTKMVR